MKSPLLLRLAVALALSTLAPGCLRAEWRRESRYTPLPVGREAGLAVGSATLGECLASLGAPLWVREVPVAGADGALLAWGWYESSDFGFRVSYALDRYATASFDWQQVDADMEGLVAVFDADWTLVELERGLLRDLVVEGRPARPTARTGASAGG